MLLLPGYLIRSSIDTTSLIDYGVAGENDGYCAPIFREGDSPFEYIPISENPKYKSKEPRTYATAAARNTNFGTHLSDFLDEEDRRLKNGTVRSTASLQVHMDPEFETCTYGDYWKEDKGRIPRELQTLSEKSDRTYLFFYAGLSPYDPEVYRSKRSIQRLATHQIRKKPVFVIGYLGIEKDCVRDVAKTGWREFEDRFSNNAHFKRERDFPVVIAGDRDDSNLLDEAIQLNHWSKRVRKYVPTDVGKKLCLASSKGVRVTKWLNDAQTSYLKDLCERHCVR